MVKRYLIASDFDQTLSLQDSGDLLAQLLGFDEFREKVAALERSHLVQPGAELAYLLRHDPAFRAARAHHLSEVGRRLRLKPNVSELVAFLRQGLPDMQFHLAVVSAAPQEVVESALAGLVEPHQIFATQFDFGPDGEIEAVRRVGAGSSKTAVIGQLQSRLQIRPERTIYLGDDVPVAHLVHSAGGYTVGRRSGNAMSLLIPILQDLAGWTSARIHQLLETCGLAPEDRAPARTDWLVVEQPRPYILK